MPGDPAVADLNETGDVGSVITRQLTALCTFVVVARQFRREAPAQSIPRQVEQASTHGMNEHRWGILEVAILPGCFGVYFVVLAALLG
jgi:hypothetical protein